MKKSKEREKAKEVVREKEFCPACGSTMISIVGDDYSCANCRAIFKKPRKAKIRLSKKASYIG